MIKREYVYKTFGKASNLFKRVSSSNVCIDVLLILFSASLTTLMKKKEDISAPVAKPRRYKTTDGNEKVVYEC